MQAPFDPPHPDARPAARRLAIGGAVAAFLVALLLIAALMRGAASAARDDAEAEMWKTHTLQVLIDAQRLFSAVQDAETGQRGFLLTGSDRYLEPYRAGAAAARAGLTRLERRTADNPRQRARLALARRAVDAKLDELAQTVALARAGRRAEALAIVRSDLGKDLMDSIRTEMRAVVGEEERLLALRTAQKERTDTREQLLLFGSAAAAVLLLLIGGAAALWAMRNALAARAAEQEARSARRLLEARGRADVAEARYEAIVEGAADFAIIGLDERGLITSWNSGARHIVGFTPEQAIGQPGDIIFKPEDRAAGAPERELGTAATSGTAVDERWHVRADGSLFWGSGLLIRLPTGGYVKIFRDRTPERAAEERMLASEARFRTLAATMPALVFLADADGANTWTNATFQQYAGKDADELNGGGWLDTLHPEDRERASAAWSQAWQTGSAYEAEYRFKHHADGFRWHKVRGTAVRDANGRVTQWVGACTDVQDAVEAREALAATNADLENRVAARTAELARAVEQLRGEIAERESAEAQVRQLQKMEAVGQLTGGIAHDFNNMLAIVIGSLDMAKRRVASDPDRATKGIENAEEGARRAAQLTARLLAFSRRQPLEPDVIDTNKLVGGMSELLRRTIGDVVRVETVLAGGLWKTFADAGQLENALVNLCVNARDAMPGGGKLTIETVNAHLDDAYAAAQAEVEPGQYVAVCVSDTGTGMPPQVIERAFDPFYTTKGVGKGTGLGLSQVYGFVKQSGGHVKIYSELGQGTTVKLYLPRFYGDARTAASERRAPSGELPRAQEGEVVLVVEDEAGVRHMSTDALRELGYTVLEASDGEEALSVLELQPRIDLLFTDIVMPGMNGRKLADEAAVRRPGTRVLFTTGYTQNAVVHNGTLDPGVAFLPKPFTVQALAQKVRAVLDGGGINRPAD